MSALAAMKEKNMMLQKSLSAETRLKLDLFSALGEAKRRIEILNGTFIFISIIIDRAKIQLHIQYAAITLIQ